MYKNCTVVNLAELMSAKGLFDVRRTNLIPHGDRTQWMAGTPGMFSGQVVGVLQADGCSLCMMHSHFSGFIMEFPLSQLAITTH